MTNVLETVKIPNTLCLKLQAYFEDYMAKKDVLSSVIEAHMYDSEGDIVESKPFAAYEKKFAKAKIEYETALKEVQETFIPEKYKDVMYKFEVDFDNSELKISKI